MEICQGTFRAMGTTVALITDGDAEPRAFRRAMREVQAIFEREEQRFSRFRESSELSRVNAAAGTGPVPASRPFLELTRLALQAAEETHGSFDPTLLPELVAAGYDRDFDELRAQRASRAGTPSARRALSHSRRWNEVEVGGATILLPVGVALDFGGIAKGWTVDLAIEAAAEHLPWALVNAGGDLRLLGAPGEALGIMIEDPDSPTQEALRVALEQGALATSSTRRRTWGEDAHHLIDPRTGEPSRTGIVQATTWAQTCARAEVLSKWALLNGPGTLLGVPQLLVHEDGTSISTFGSQLVDA